MGRTYAISDVHGMGHLLDQMLEKIAFSEADRLYVLGDLIDRGPDPAGVLDLAMERKNIIALKGNHEDAFVDWYDTVPDKIHNRYYYNTYDFLMDSRRTRERLPEYVEFMRKMPLYKKLRIDGECWLLAHACTEEVLSFWKRKERMLWSTEMIDRGKGIPGYHSVVGHVPAFTIRGNTNRPAKIWHSEDGWLTDIDCGAAFPAFGGRLGCLCLETGETAVPVEKAQEGKAADTRRRKGRQADYETTFFKGMDIPARYGKPVYVRREYHERIAKISVMLTGGKVSLSAYIDNVLAQHFEQYREEIEAAYAGKLENLY